MKTLARLSATMLAEDRIKDEQVLKTFSASSEPRELVHAALGQSFRQDSYCARKCLNSRGPLTQEDFIYRLWVVYGRVAAFIQEFLEVEGWTDDFAPALVAYQDGQINLAIKTPTNQPLPSSCPWAKYWPKGSDLRLDERSCANRYPGADHGEWDAALV